MNRIGSFFFSFLVLTLFIPSARAESFDPANIHAIYLSIDNLHSSKKIAELESLIRNTSANGIVIDFKDSNKPNLAHMTALVRRFHSAGAHTIARIVTFQDRRLAQEMPTIAVKNGSGAFWWSGLKKWKRYWVDPASEYAQNDNIAFAKQAIDCGFDEIQFDYIRFPTDGDMKDIHFPIFDPSKGTKSQVMERFFRRIQSELKAYAPHILIGIDLFGEVFLYSKERGIGQDLIAATAYFDVLSPMAYPSHYKCMAFGKVAPQDPNWHPYLVASSTLKKGTAFLKTIDKKIIIRPWIQGFTWPNIYGCSSKKDTPEYGPERIKAQIRAGDDLGIKGFMLWNVGNNFSPKIFE